jgi:hypothetical protein
VFALTNNEDEKVRLVLFFVSNQCSDNSSQTSWPFMAEGLRLVATDNRSVFRLVLPSRVTALVRWQPVGLMVRRRI